MTDEGMISGIAGTVAGCPSGGETAETGAVEQQRAAVPDLRRHHVARDQLVIAAVEDVAQATLDHGQRALEHRRSSDARSPADTVELVAPGDSEGAAQRLLVLLEDVHAECAGLADARPAR